MTTQTTIDIPALLDEQKVSSFQIRVLVLLATAMADSASSLMILRFIGGLGLGGVMPNAIALTSEFCPRRSRGTMVMVMFCGFPIGATIAGFAAAPIIPTFGC